MRHAAAGPPGPHGLPTVPANEVQAQSIESSLDDPRVPLTLQEASAATADTAAAAAAAEPTDLPALHRLAWLSQERPLVEERLDGLAAKLAPAGRAVDALQQLVKHIEEEQVGGGTWAERWSFALL